MSGSRSLELLVKKLKGFQTSCCMKERAFGSSICLVNQRMAAKSVGHICIWTQKPRRGLMEARMDYLMSIWQETFK
jgi:hypothetical protein